MSGVIYKIVTGNEVYVGSTMDYKHRLKCHRAVVNNPKCKGYNLKLYKTIRTNGEWEMSIYKENLSMTKEELRIYEDEIVLLLGATLNDKKAHRSDDDMKEWQKNWNEVNKEELVIKHKEYRIINKHQIRAKQLAKIKCECGSISCVSSIARHRKSAKHARLMTSPELP